ncbi:hypothetical protein HYE11_02205 [Mycoplasmopsis bovis]|nr:hypothetical protein HYE11_02205 [Mycoplasmopsis bovis]
MTNNNEEKHYDERYVWFLEMKRQSKLEVLTKVEVLIKALKLLRWI